MYQRKGETKKRAPRLDLNFQNIKSSVSKQTKTREVADEEVMYIDSSRNISVAFGEEDLKENLNEQGLDTGILQEEKGVPTSDLFHREALYHFKKKNFAHALECAARAQDLLEEVDYDILTTQADLEFQNGNYNNALKIAGTVLREKKKSWKAIYIKAECLYNLCEFEHALIMYHKGRCFFNPDSTTKNR